MKTNDTKSSPRVHVARSGAVCANVWANFYQGRCEFRVTLTCSYKDQAKRWQRGRTFFSDEMPRVAEVIAKADRWIRKNQASETPADEAIY